MNKIVIRRPGGFEELRLEPHPEPEPAAGEVVVATRAIGVNYADCIARMGLYKSANQFAGWPPHSGFEFAGVVAALGEGVAGFSVGERVLGVSRFGPTRARPGPSVAALAAAAEHRLRAGRRVPGGVSHGLVRLVRARRREGGLDRARVFGRGRRRQRGLPAREERRSEGAGRRGFGSQSRARAGTGCRACRRPRSGPASKQAREFSPRGFDVVLDANGATTLRTSFELLAPMGRLVVYGFSSMISTEKPNFLRLLWRYLRTPRFNPLEMVDRNARGVCLHHRTWSASSASTARP